MGTILNLPTVTLMCADCVNLEYAIASLERCKSLCSFGAVKFFTSLETDYPHIVINPMTTVCDYSAFILKRLHEFIETSHLLLVQWDAWILNSDVWNSAWLDYDYVAPLFIHNHVIVPSSVGCGGFSLRSKALMAAVSRMLPAWDGGSGSHDATWGHEDGVVALRLRAGLEVAGFRFAPPAEAARFCQAGQTDPQYYVRKPFGFHGWWANIDRDAGVVNPFPLR